jgi:pyruvate formate lyase activating enzyme
MRVRDVVDEVMRDEAFYRNSGGGVTMSGGEPLLQADFVVGLLRELKKRGVHTAVDTSGYVAWSQVEKVLPHADLLLFDVKHLDDERHLRATGVHNGPILENLKKASGLLPLWLRLPLIGDFNDGEEYIRRVALLGKEIGAEKISLLPYHEGGKSKCEQLGRPYPFPDGRPVADEHVNDLKGIFEKEGLRVGVGS